MKVLVTGASGFIGKNLVLELRNRGFESIFEVTRDTDADLLEQYCSEADFVFHLAGVNRPQQDEEFMIGNRDLTARLVEVLEAKNNRCPILLSSSIHAEGDSLYGKSKRAAEEILFTHAQKCGRDLFVYRLPNTFGKWSKPNYNSVIATFCYNISRGIPIRIDDPSVILRLVYIDDVVAEWIRVLKGERRCTGDLCLIPVEYRFSLAEIAERLLSFRESRENLMLPDLKDEFTKKLYSTYLSFLPKDGFSYDLRTHADHRGSFTEFVRTQGSGQVSINVSKPGIIKGNHWHHTKNEKFLVVKGRGVVRFRDIFSDEVIEYFVDDERLQVIDIPVGYTHNIENLGDEDMVTVMWANECFDPEDPDTYFLEV